jgi:hypothetical protein
MANNIVLHQFGSVSVGLNKKDGYINATKLCVAYNIANGTSKQPSDWTKTKRAEAYIAYVASVRNILRTELVVVKQGQNHDEQGTWIHPDLAVPFATWLSVEFEYQVSQWIQDWNQNKHLQQYPERLIGEIAKAPAIAAIEFIGTAIDIALSHVPQELRAGNKIESICTMFPEYRSALEPHKPKLLLDAPLLSPKALGELMSPPISAIAMNKLLCDRGFQEKTGEKNPAYRLIGQGHEFGKVVADTAIGHGKTVQHVRWYESVLSAL